MDILIFLHQEYKKIHSPNVSWDTLQTIRLKHPLSIQSYFVFYTTFSFTSSASLGEKWSSKTYHFFRLLPLYFRKVQPFTVFKFEALL